MRRTSVFCCRMIRLVVIDHALLKNKKKVDSGSPEMEKLDVARDQADDLLEQLKRLMESYQQL